MFEFRTGQAMVKVVEGLHCKCPNCDTELIPTNGIVPCPKVGEKVECASCEHDVTDILHALVGNPEKVPNPIFGVGEIEQLIPKNSRFTNEQLLGESKEGLVSMIRDLEERLAEAIKRERDTDERYGDVIEALRNSRDAQKVIEQILGDDE